MTIAKVSEITSTSTKSFDDAIEKGVKRASKTLKNLTGLGRRPGSHDRERQDHGVPRAPAGDLHPRGLSRARLPLALLAARSLSALGRRPGVDRAEGPRRAHRLGRPVAGRARRAHARGVRGGPRPGRDQHPAHRAGGTRRGARRRTRAATSSCTAAPATAPRRRSACSRSPASSGSSTCRATTRAGARKSARSSRPSDLPLPRGCGAGPAPRVHRLRRARRLAGRWPRARLAAPAGRRWGGWISSPARSAR